MGFYDADFIAFRERLTKTTTTKIKESMTILVECHHRLEIESNESIRNKLIAKMQSEAKLLFKYFTSLNYVGSTVDSIYPQPSDIEQYHINLIMKTGEDDLNANLTEMYNKTSLCFQEINMLQKQLSEKMTNQEKLELTNRLNQLRYSLGQFWMPNEDMGEVRTIIHYAVADLSDGQKEYLRDCVKFYLDVQKENQSNNIFSRIGNVADKALTGFGKKVGGTVRDTGRKISIGLISMGDGLIDLSVKANSQFDKVYDKLDQMTEDMQFAIAKKELKGMQQKVRAIYQKKYPNISENELDALYREHFAEIKKFLLVEYPIIEQSVNQIRAEFKTKGSLRYNEKALEKYLFTNISKYGDFKYFEGRLQDVNILHYEYDEIN